MFLEFKSGGFRQYVTLTLLQNLFGRFVIINRIDFIQEQWQVNVLDQDEIDQWMISADGNGMARDVWHKRLLEEKGAVLQEEFYATDEDGTKAIVEKIVARFLPSNMIPVLDEIPPERADCGALGEGGTMTVKRPTLLTCASARPMNRTLRKATFTGSAVQPQARQALALKGGSSTN